MSATVDVDARWNIGAICEAAGNADIEARHVFLDKARGVHVLTVDDVPQAALESAVAAYDHAAATKASRRAGQLPELIDGLKPQQKAALVARIDAAMRKAWIRAHPNEVFRLAAETGIAFPDE